ncbi:transporter substrate-binding domain-containing protein, partial [Streptococcus sobrinus]
MSFKKIVTAVLVVLMSFSLVACSNSGKSAKKDTSLSDVQKRGTLVVATSPDFAPFEFKRLVNSKDTVAGVDVELSKEIAKELNVKI